MLRGGGEWVLGSVTNVEPGTTSLRHSVLIRVAVLTRGLGGTGNVTIASFGTTTSGFVARDVVGSARVGRPRIVDRILDTA